MSLLRSLATVGGYTGISRILGFVRDILMAAVIGTGPVADAFFVAFRFPNFFRRLFAEGAFSAAFVPLFSRRLEEDGREAARRLAEETLSVLTAVLLALTLAALVAMPQLMHLLAPGFADDPEKFDQAVLLTRLTFPYLLFVSLVALYGGVLNALYKFAAMAAAPILLNVFFIATLLLVIPLADAPAGPALAWTVTLAGIAQFLALIYAARRNGITLDFPLPRLTPGVRRTLRLMGPGVASAGALQLNLVVGTIVASLQPGAVSYLYYADRVYQLPLGLIGIAFGVVLLPDLSRKLRAGQDEAARASLNRGIELALLLTLLFASGVASQWEEALKFTSGETYGQTDPIFERDVAFYMLRLPFLEVLQDVSTGMCFLGLLIVVFVYVVIGDFVIQGGRVQARPKVLRHVAVNVALLLAAWGWGFYLDRYGLLQTPGGVVHGAGYTDVHVVLPALWVMIVLTAVLVVLVLTRVVVRRPGVLLAAAGVYLVTAFVGLTLLPGLVQQISVEPNELELERPYLQYNIDLTREAFGLTAVRSRQYGATPGLTAADIQGQEETLRNIRLWDPRLLIDTYSQLQEIRTYYQFYSVDIDRYVIDGQYRQVMLAARELTQRLPSRADTWFNRHLQYTHGYGAVMSPVSQRGAEGVPELIIRNMPPEITVEGLQVTRPAIYYGERTPHYRIVPAGAPGETVRLGQYFDGTRPVNSGSTRSRPATIASTVRSHCHW